MKIGYIRVSDKKQNPDRQIEKCWPSESKNASFLSIGKAEKILRGRHTSR